MKAVLDAKKMMQEVILSLQNDGREGCLSRVNKLLRVWADYTLTRSSRDQLGLVYAGSEKNEEGHWKISNDMTAALKEVPMFVLRHQDLVVAASDKYVVTYVSLDDE
ncbi:hypothetical protein BGZ82_005831 [Podila clonocystis]|nr:hypothetical protein BGZ82_005831 [Podila clonocystis]